jgi:hypothetical protein
MPHLPRKYSYWKKPEVSISMLSLSLLYGKHVHTVTCLVLEHLRHVRKDERMDALVALFFPGGRAAAAKAKEEASASFKRSDISAAAQRHQQMVAIMREKAKAAAQRNLELQRVAAAAARAEAEARAKIAAAEAASRKRSREEQEEIAHSTLRGRIDNSVAFALRQYPGERVLKEASVGEIRTSGNATVLNLKSFIRAILEVSNPGVAFSSSQIEIILSVPGGRTHASSTAASCSSSHSDGATSFKLIDNQLSLGALHKFFGDQNISPVLIYRTTTGVINPVP